MSIRLKVHSSDSDRIMENFTRTFAFQMENQEYKLALKTFQITMRDLWISAHEYKWHLRRKKLRESIRDYNFETDVKTDLREIDSL